MGAGASATSPRPSNPTNPSQTRSKIINRRSDILRKVRKLKLNTNTSFSSTSTSSSKSPIRKRPKSLPPPRASPSPSHTLSSPSSRRTRPKPSAKSPLSLIDPILQHSINSNDVSSTQLSREHIRTLRHERWNRKRNSLNKRSPKAFSSPSPSPSSTKRRSKSNTPTSRNKNNAFTFDVSEFQKSSINTEALSNSNLPPTPSLALSTSNSLVIRLKSPKSPKSSPKSLSPLPSSSVPEIQYRTKDEKIWHPLNHHTDNKTHPHSHTRMTCSIRSTACTVSNLVTYCVPMSFRVRHILHHTTTTPWSLSSEWFQTSPNRPARPTSLECGTHTTTTSIEVVWKEVNNNGAAITKYTLYGTKEMDAEPTQYYEGTGLKCIIGTPPLNTNQQTMHLSTEEENDKVTDIRIRPGETILFYLIATNFIGDSVPSESFAFTALDPPKPKTTRSQQQGESKYSNNKGDALPKCQFSHEMAFKLLKNNICDLCNAKIQKSNGFRCDMCNYDICITCGHQETNHRKETKSNHTKSSPSPGISNIMNAWRTKAKQAAIRTEQQAQSYRNSNTQLYTQQKEWEMPTQPTRICQLPNGWIECWDPATEHCYYHDPRTDLTTWTHPCPHLVEATFDTHFTEDDLFLSPFNNTTTTTTNNNNTTTSSSSSSKNKRSRPNMPSSTIPFRQKRFKFLWHVRGNPSTGGCKMINIQINRTSLVSDTFTSIFNMSNTDLLKKFKIMYQNEIGIDSGGLTKDWFLEISNKLVNPSYCLFRKSGVSSEYYDIDSRSDVNTAHLDYFYIFGRILGKAIYDRHLIDVPFSQLFFKRLLNTSTSKNSYTLKDVEQDDVEYARSLKWILNENIDSVELDLTFSVTRSSVGNVVHEVPLLPNGINITVTDANKIKYVNLLVQWHCELSIRNQINALRRGFFQLMPSNKINIFTVEELDLLIGGVKDIDVELLQNVCIYKGGYENIDVEKNSSVNYFWDILKEMELEMKRKVLRFITGTTRIPLDGFDPCFQICKASRGGEEGDEQVALPTAHTCFNQLVLPAYKSRELMKEKLLYALEESDGTFGMT